MALRGDLSKIRDLKRSINALPFSVAHEVAKRLAPDLTDLARTAYDSGRTVYGEARPLGEHGNALTLKDTGDVERTVKFVANGTIIRCVLGPKYSKYLIGKYSILPNGRMPAGWKARFDERIAEVQRERAKQGVIA